MQLSIQKRYTRIASPRFQESGVFVVYVDFVKARVSSRCRRAGGGMSVRISGEVRWILMVLFQYWNWGRM